MCLWSPEKARTQTSDSINGIEKLARGLAILQKNSIANLDIKLGNIILVKTQNKITSVFTRSQILA